MATKQSKSSVFPQIPGYSGDFGDTNVIGSGTGSSTGFTTPLTPDQVEDVKNQLEYPNYSDIQRLVVSSEIYKRVYAIFSKLSDPYWSNQLQSIIDSLQDPQSTFWDKLGLSTSLEDKKDAIYSEAISQISQLYASYQQYINSLPTTQVQQLLNAGSNSIVNGGLSTSTLETDISPNAGEQIQRNTVGEFTDFLGSIMDLGSGIFGVAQTIQNIFQSGSLFPSARSLAQLGLKSAQLGLKSQELGLNSAQLGLKSQEIGLQSARSDLAKKGVYVTLDDDGNLDPDSASNLSALLLSSSHNIQSDLNDAQSREIISGAKTGTVTEQSFQGILYDIAQLEILNKLSGLDLQNQQNKFNLEVLGLTDPTLVADATNQGNIEKSSTSKLNTFINSKYSDLITKYSKDSSMLGTYMLIQLVQHAPIDFRATMFKSLFDNVETLSTNPDANLFDLFNSLLGIN